MQELESQIQENNKKIVRGSWNKKQPEPQKEETNPVFADDPLQISGSLQKSIKKANNIEIDFEEIEVNVNKNR